LAPLPFVTSTGTGPELSKANADNGPTDAALSCNLLAATLLAETVCPAIADEATAVNEEIIAIEIASFRNMILLLDVKALDCAMNTGSRRHA
jgi:hypothetical protein